MLCREGWTVNRKRVRQLMRVMRIEAIYQKPNTSRSHSEHVVYPYLLRGLVIDRANQVWCADITYIPMSKGFVYLVAVMDWFSRRVLAWRVSTDMDKAFCIDALREALARYGSPKIFNTDQGSQFTSAEFTGELKASCVRISMDGKGRYLDNIFIERLWRSLKYEDVYIKAYASVAGGPSRHRRMVELLQRRPPAPGSGLPDAARGVPDVSAPWICGQRKRVDHIPTGPSSAARKGFN